MRLTWDEYFMSQAILMSARGTCPRAKVGAVITKKKKVIATGYNGSVVCEKHCIDDDCLLKDGHCVRTVHAEINAICQCARTGSNCENSTIYITHFPCLACTKSLIQSGISEIVYFHEYRRDPYADELLRLSGIRLRQFSVSQETIMKSISEIYEKDEN